MILVKKKIVVSISTFNINSGYVIIWFNVYQEILNNITCDLICYFYVAKICLKHFEISGNARLFVKIMLILKHLCRKYILQFTRNA